MQSFHILDDWSYTRSILNQISRMIQSYHILDDQSYTGSILNWSSRMIQSCHILNDRISPDHFWTYVPRWYNPSSFSKIEVSRSLLDICPRMIQSLFILEDQGLWVTLGQVSRDDTIPVQHHYSPFRRRSFRTTPILSRKCLNFTWDRGFVSTSETKPSSSTSSVCEY